MGIKVAKFGGSSLADAGQFIKVQSIIRKDRMRRYVVPSAPGKRYDGDIKVTDLLYRLYDEVAAGRDGRDVLNLLIRRFMGIIQDLELAMDLRSELEQVAADIAEGASRDYAASRGEYFSGKILAELLGYDFVDPAGVILFDEKGQLDMERTQKCLSEKLLQHRRAVIPGFFGSMPDGSVRTFSRGGSDITGSLVARAVQAELYENWTDVSGFLMADPRIVDDPKIIDLITYQELRELSYMGATVLHEDCVFPARKAGIPIRVLNTNRPEDPGTLITDKYPEERPKKIITGISGRKNMCVLSIEKNLMNAELGFGRRVLEALEENGVSFEHLPTGIDTMSVVIQEAQLEGGKLEKIMKRIEETCHPDSMEVLRHLSLVATVGIGMVSTLGTAARLFNALARAGVNVRMIDQGSSELNIIVGVSDEDFGRAIRGIYNYFAVEG